MIAALLGMIGGAGMLPLIGGGLGVIPLVIGFFKQGTAAFLPYILIGLAVIVGGAVSYHFIQVAHYESQVAQLVADKAGLVVDNQRLSDSNKSLEGTIANFKSANALMISQITAFQSADAQAKAALAAANAKIRDKDRQVVAEKARTGKQVGLYLNTVNRNVACETAHLTDTNGSCINGAWVAKKYE